MHHIPGAPLRRGAAVVAALALAVAGLVVNPTTTAVAAVPDLTFGVATGETRGIFVGQTGPYAVAINSSVPQVSADAGATWRDAPVGGSNSVVSKGYLYANAHGSVTAYPLAGGTPLVQPNGDRGLGAVWGARATMIDYSGPSRIIDMVTGQEVLHVTDGAVLGMGPSGVALSLYWGSSDTETYRVLTWAGATRADVELPARDVGEVVVAGDELRYLRLTDTDVQYCAQPLSGGPTACVALVQGDHRDQRYSFLLGGSETAALVRWPGALVKIENGRVAAVSVPEGTSVVPTATDGGRPVVTISGYPFSVAPDGSLARTLVYPRGPLDTEVVGLTPGRVVTADSRPDPASGRLGAWSRSVSATVVGGETLLPARATTRPMRSSRGSSFLSGLRTLLLTDVTDGVAVLDGTSQTASLHADVEATISGPYVLADGRLFSQAGRDLGIAGDAIFGSRLARADADAIRLYDVARSTTTPIRTIPKPAGLTDWYLAGLYGDWIVVLQGRGTGDSQSWTAVAQNLATGATATRPAQGYIDAARVEEVGDGFALTEGGIWRFADNTVVPGPTNDYPFFTSDRVNRLAFVQGGTVTIRTLEGVGTSPARVLGVTASASLDVAAAGAAWTPQIDASKGITAGRIVVRNASNMVVREIATPASEVGAVRSVSWDGRNAAGQSVPNGTYTWEFVAASADGTGAVKAVDGTSAVTGAITVTGWGGFADVPPGTQHYDHIMWLAGRGITTGYPDNTYRPVQSVNRDAMAAFMYRLAGSPAFTPTRQTFVDVTPSSQFYTEIEWLAAQGISTGWSTAAGKEFRPLQPVNRDAMAAFLYRLYSSPSFTAPTRSPFVDVSVGSQFYKEMSWLAASGISTGWVNGSTAEFRPLSPVGRDAMAAFMHRAYTTFGTPRA